MNFYIITIQTDTKGIIIITPKNFYIISDHEVKYVVMYNLKYKHNEQEIESDIPYYVSNGVTNKLRANMLYPFMCYSNIMEIGICPYDPSRKNKRNNNESILLKYRIGEYINIDQLERQLLYTFLDMYPSLEEEKNRMRNKIAFKYLQGDDLISVLQRITNLVDFIICIVNDNIRNFDYTQEQVDIDNGKYRPLSDEQKKENIDYINLSIFGQETIYNGYTRYQDDSSSEFNNHFRAVILTILNKYYKLFSENKIIKIQPIILEGETITINRFNKIADICEKEKSRSNIKFYKSISDKLYEIVTEKIDITENMSDENKLLLKSILEQTANKELLNNLLYDELLNVWNVQCPSKSNNINNKHIYEMTEEEICKELTNYTDFTQTIYKIRQEIQQNCNAETMDVNRDKRLKILIHNLLIARSNYILYNYSGQLEFKLIIISKTKADIKMPDFTDALHLDMSQERKEASSGKSTYSESQTNAAERALKVESLAALRWSKAEVQAALEQNGWDEQAAERALEIQRMEALGWSKDEAEAELEQNGKNDDDFIRTTKKLIKYNKIYKIIKLDVDSSDTIFMLKSKIYNIEGIPELDQQIFFERDFGSIIIHLEDNMTLSSYKIRNNSQLTVLIKNNEH